MEVIPPGSPVMYYFVKFFPANNEALEHIVRLVTIAAASIMARRDEAPYYA